MPGLVGLLTRLPSSHAERALERMLDTLCHQATYERGTWSDEALGLYVGWCTGGESLQPREFGDAVVLLHGQSALTPRADGAPTDPSFLRRLNGRYHGLVIDRCARGATLFNDRYGLGRVYWHQSQDAFLFAAEAKAILAIRPECRSIEPRGLAELVSCGCVLDNRTLFRGIDVLPPGARWLLREGIVERRESYFDLREWEAQAPADTEVYGGELRDVLTDVMPRYVGEDDRVGISLSGGLDTRLIMAVLKPRAGTLPCYTFGGALRDSRDVRIAREVARACKQSHQVIRVGPELLSRFAAYAERTVHLTDGCADVSRAPDLFLNEAARRIAPVRLTGNYGSEVLRRVRAFKPVAPTPGLFSSDFLPSVAQAEQKFGQLASAPPLSFIVSAQLPWHHFGLLALEESQLTSRSPFLDNEVVRTAFRAPPEAWSDVFVHRLIGLIDPELASIGTDRAQGETGMSGTASRLLRETQFKAEYLFDYGLPQWLAPLERLLAPLHPERVLLGHHKLAHFRVWYRDALASYVHDILLDPKTLARPFLVRRQVEALVREHTEGRRNHTVAIHKLLTIELVHRLFID